MTDSEMEEIYESLATKIDAFGKEKSDIFLAKLALILSKKFTDLEGQGGLDDIGMNKTSLVDAINEEITRCDVRHT